MFESEHIVENRECEGWPTSTSALHYSRSDSIWSRPIKKLVLASILMKLLG